MPDNNGNVRIPKLFDPPSSPEQSWDIWKDEFLTYMRATEKINKPPEVQHALFKNSLGVTYRQVYDTFKIKSNTPLDAVLNHFDAYFKPLINVDLERYKIMQRMQTPGESIDKFVADIKVQAKKCDYENKFNSMVKTHVICGLLDKKLQQELFNDKSLTLLEVIEKVRIAEANKSQSEKVFQPNKVSSQDVNTVHSRDFKKSYSNEPGEKPTAFSKQQSNAADSSKGSFPKKPCSRCGSYHPPRKCPAHGKICIKCQKKNHFSAQCRQDQVHEVQVYDNDNENNFYDFSVATISDSNVNSLEWTENLKIHNLDILFKLDTGASINIIPKDKFDLIEGKPALQSAGNRLTSYSGHHISVIGSCYLKVNVNKGFGPRESKLFFYVVPQGLTPILGLEGCTALNLIERVNFISREDVFKQYPDVFDSNKIGLVPYTYDIKLREDAVPKIFPARPIPVSLQDKVKAELDRMVKEGILVKTEGPTEWVHPICVVTKPNKSIRIVMDPLVLNKYILREHYSMPSKQSIFSQLSGGKFFSVLDAKSAFLQIPLTEASSRICTIATPFGRYSYKRLPYGLASSPEVFQRIISQILDGLPATHPFLDDVLTKGASKLEHDQRLKAILDRCRQNNFTLSKEKAQLCKPEITYIGYKISAEGVSVHPDKVAAIVQYPVPKTKLELQRFLGMLTYLGDHIENLADKTALLRNLLRKDTPFLWEANEQKAFDNLKEIICKAPVLVHFDPKTPCVLSVDCSQYGAGGVLLQENRPVAYSSFSLNSTQQEYSQIEKELLAIYAGCFKFEYYLYGRHFVVQTDHKPLIGIYKKPISSLSPRLQRMRYKLLRFDFELIHVPGKQLYVADALSRAPLPDHFDTSFLEEPTFVFCLVTGTQQSHSVLVAATNQDPALTLVKTYHANGWPNHKKDCGLAKDYFELRTLIYEKNGLLFYDHRLIVPTSLRPKMLEKLHLSHQGIVATKKRASMTLYWPGLMKDVETTVSTCQSCQQFSRSNIREPMTVEDPPSLPWERLAIDFQYLYTKDYLVVVDYFSKFVVIRQVKSKTAITVISVLKSVFELLGLPKCLRSDNGPPYDSAEFADFVKFYDIDHKPSSPCYPQSNGMIERTIGSVKAMYEKCINSQNDLTLAVLEYNSTPRNNLPAPSQLLMGRLLRTTLPVSNQVLKPNFPVDDAREVLVENQTKQKAYYDRGKTRLPDLKVGDPIFSQIHGKDWTPGVVTAYVPPNSFIVSCDGRTYRRNRVHIKFRTIAASPDSDSAPLPTDNSKLPTVPVMPNVTARPVRNKKAPTALKDFVR